MQNIPLIDKKDVQFANEKLAKFYENSFIPAEKKTYLTELKNSTGPYMGIQSPSGETHFLMDAASQIATLGLGFNSSAFFGVAHHIEAWLNEPNTDNFQKIDQGFKNFLKRKTKWNELNVKYCHSGAEANEMALGFCYAKRVNPLAKKVLAFEGSFHGRMMVSLASTWNKTKREPFEWPGFQTEFCPYPETEDDNFISNIPIGWREAWDHAPHKDFQTPNEWNDNQQLKQEVDCLLAVREKLLSREIFAIIIEPMQCEGGDRYSTDRFHTALLLMAKSFKVPLIYDEVQTGFHLGREFFWHRQFNLKDAHGEALCPDYIVCAKKAQIGMVISKDNYESEENPQEFQVASTIRGYYHALLLDQYQPRITHLEEKARTLLLSLVEKNSKHICRPRACGLSFAFDLKEPELVAKFIALRFDHGLLYYPAGSKTLRFRLNTGFSEEDLNFLFERLDNICDQLFEGKEFNAPKPLTSKDRGVEQLYYWHELFLETRLALLAGESTDFDTSFNLLKEHFRTTSAVELQLINKQNFKSYSDKIEKLQQKVYEPARQTAIDNFEKVANSDNGLALAIERDGKLMGITFASPLQEHPMERGTREDPYYEDPNSLYMLDVTVDNSLRGLGLGKNLKYALTLLSLQKGAKRIQGRNRDRLASEMLNINLSLGAYEQVYRVEDYPDFEKYRDVMYYSIPLNWNLPSLNLSNAINTPNNIDSLDSNYLKEQLPYLNNKVCLSNFVSERFLSQVQNVLKELPEDLSHAYTTSGQSECVDKTAKSLWYMRNENQKGFKQLTFKGHYFGGGSFLSRSLSNNEDPFFPVTRLPHPDADNYPNILNTIEEEIKKGEYLAIWLEPLTQMTMKRVPYEFLAELKRLTSKYHVPVVYNETASQMYRYNNDSYFLSEDKIIAPSAGMAYLGGQAGVVFVEKDKFIEKPLMLISTWDGDEFSFSNYNLAANKIRENKDDYLKTKFEFEKTLTTLLMQYQVDEIQLDNGIGFFKGDIPNTLANYFNYKDGRYLVCPSYDNMLRFVKEMKDV